MSERETWGQYQKLVLNLLEQHDGKLEALRVQLNSANNDKAALSENILSMKEDLILLLNIVRDGTVTVVPILTRLTQIENDIKNINLIEANKKKELSEITGYKRALFVSILGIIASIGWDLFQKIIMAGK